MLHISPYLIEPHLSLIVRLLSINGAAYVGHGLVAMIERTRVNSLALLSPDVLELAIQVITLVALIVTIGRRVYRHYQPTEEEIKEDERQRKVQEAILLLADSQSDARPLLTDAEVQRVVQELDDTDLPKKSIREILNKYRIDYES